MPRTRAEGGRPDQATRLVGRSLSCSAWLSRGPLPVDRLIRKHVKLAIVEVVLIGLKCPNCGGYGASVLMLKLCEPGCPR